jgi:hypothetical protein
LITHFFSFFYFLPAVSLVFGCIVGETAANVDVVTRRSIFATGTAVLLCFWFAFSPLRSWLESIPVSVFATAGILFVTVSAVKRMQSAALASTMLFAALAQLVFYHPIRGQSFAQRSDGVILPISVPRSDYSGIHNAAWGDLESNTYWGSVELLRWIGQQAPPNEGRVGFWYSNDGRHSAISSVQSIFLWGYSRVQDWDLPSGLPILDAVTRKNIDACHYIVLLGFSAEEIDSGLVALRDGGIRFKEIERRRFAGKVMSFEALIVERLPSEPKISGIVVDPAIASFKASGGEISATQNGIKITTAAPQWSYSAIAGVASMHLPAERRTFRLRLQVRSGSIGVALSEAGNISNLLNEVEAGPSSEPIDIAIPVDDASKVENIILRNHAAAGPSIVELFQRR